jgi:aldose 1-epimerase
VIELRNGSTTALVDDSKGGRLGSLVVAGRERLVTADRSPGNDLGWGSYPMAPWAGRVRRGRFTFEGTVYDLPLRMPPHAIHGTVCEAPWTVTASSRTEVRMRCDLGPIWPWPGHAEQVIELQAGAVRCWLAVMSDGPSFPGQVGWHPWFSDGGKPPVLHFSAQAMYVRDDDYMAIDTQVAPGPHPWDDCFVGVLDAPILRYADGVSLQVSSDCDHWVVFEPEHGTCVEPQSGPPDGFTIQPRVVTPADPLSRTMVVAWA